MNEQINNLRRIGVKRAWLEEIKLVKQGKGTRQWTLYEQFLLLKFGKVKGYVGHHIRSVKRFPELADKFENIQFLKINEHFRVHLNNWTYSLCNYYDIGKKTISLTNIIPIGRRYIYDLNEKYCFNNKMGYLKETFELKYIYESLFEKNKNKLNNFMKQHVNKLKLYSDKEIEKLKFNLDMEFNISQNLGKLIIDEYIMGKNNTSISYVDLYSHTVTLSQFHKSVHLIKEKTEINDDSIKIFIEDLNKNINKNNKINYSDLTLSNKANNKLKNDSLEKNKHNNYNNKIDNQQMEIRMEANGMDVEQELKTIFDNSFINIQKNINNFFYERKKFLLSEQGKENVCREFSMNYAINENLSKLIVDEYSKNIQNESNSLFCALCRKYASNEVLRDLKIHYDKYCVVNNGKLTLKEGVKNFSVNIKNKAQMEISNNNSTFEEKVKNEVYKKIAKDWDIGDQRGLSKDIQNQNHNLVIKKGIR